MEGKKLAFMVLVALVFIITSSAQSVVFDIENQNLVADHEISELNDINSYLLMSILNRYRMSKFRNTRNL